MKSFTTFLSVIAILFSSLSIAKNDTSAAELFSKSSEFYNVKISPAGDYLSLVTSHSGKDKLLIIDSKTKKPLHVVYFPGNAQVGDYMWVNDERIVLQKTYLKGWSESPQYYGELMAVNADGSRPLYLFGYKGAEMQTGSRIKKNTAINATAFPLDPLLNDKKHMLVTAIPWGGTASSFDYKKFKVYKVNLYKGTRKKVVTAPVAKARFMTDEQGNVRIAAGVDVKNNLKVYQRKDGEWHHIKKLASNLEEFVPISFANKDTEIYASAIENNKTRSVYKVDLNSGELVKIIQDDTVDPTNVWVNQFTKKLYAVEYDAGYPEYAFVNAKDVRAEQLKQLIASIPGHRIRIISEDKHGEKLIVLAFNDRNSGDFYLFDSNKMKLEYLASSKKWLDPETMAEVKPIKFTNRDGMKIHGYLTLPHGKEAKDLPLIVNPHGGPHGIRDWWGFDSQNQFLASQGLAVLQINFRGSGGFGQDFEALGYREWGRKMQHDIIDATRYVVEQGFADKSKLCIAGGSYGGYSALQSAIIEPDLFKCVIGSFGVYDLPMMFEEGDIPKSKSGINFLNKVLGRDEEQLKVMSPSHNVNKLKAKLLLIHGEDDERAPMEQLEALEDALKERSYPYERLVIEDEGHGFYNDNNRKQEYEKMLSFIKESLNL